MSGLNLLGGIGKGLMTGSQFIQQKNAQDMQLQQNQARLGMLQEDMNWQRQDRAEKQAEKTRLAELDQIAASTWSEMGPEADPLQVSSEIFKRSVTSGKAKRAEIEPLLKSVKELRQRGVTAALRMGDAGKLGDALSQSFGRRVSVQPTQGADEFGRPSQLFTVMGEDGTPLRSFTMMQLGSILGADDILADQERQLKLEELRSKSVENEAQAVAARASAGASGAQAGKYRAETEQVRLENTGLAALAPAERARSKSGNIPAAIQEAEWFRAATPEQKAAYERVKKISDDPRVASEAMRLLTADAQIMGGMTPETAVQKVQQTYDLASGRAPTKAPAAPQGPRPTLRYVPGKGMVSIP